MAGSGSLLLSERVSVTCNSMGFVFSLKLKKNSTVVQWEVGGCIQPQGQKMFVMSLAWSHTLSTQGVWKLTVILVHEFAFVRLWLWLSEVPGAAVDLFARSYSFQGSLNATVTVWNRENSSQNGPNLAKGIKVTLMWHCQNIFFVLNQYYGKTLEHCFI